MGKRKPGDVQFENDGNRTLKKPRTDITQPAADSTEEGARYPSMNTADSLPDQKETKEARAARKLAKRLAKRQHRDNKSKVENTQGRESRDGDGDDAAAAMSPPPAKVAKSGNEPKKAHRKQSLILGDTATRAQHSRTSVVKAPKRKESEHRRKSGQAKKSQGKAKGDIRINYEGRDNKIILDDWYGRGDSLLRPDGWNLSTHSGGRMRDLDPVFSVDEEYLLIAFKSSLNIYSTATSLLVRELWPSHHQRVSAFALSPTNPNLIYIATESGQVQLWNFLTGQQVQYWVTQCSIHGLQISEPAGSEDPPDLIYTIDRGTNGPWRIRAHRFKADKEAKTYKKAKKNKAEIVCLRQSQEPITAFKVVEQGRIIVATSGSVLSVGHTDHPSPSSLTDTSYVWRDVECPEWISCIDVRIVLSGRSSKQDISSGKDASTARTDIVVGGLKGALHVYDDLLRQLIRTEKQLKKSTYVDLTSRKQHWHRNTVLSVKWSRDGNYIISGGLETTLLLWQLETGHINTLPHLGAPIEGIVVSPAGSSYAIRLSDNSAMILSTTELKPTFSIAGIHFPSTSNFGHSKLPYLPTVDFPSQKVLPTRRLHFPAVSGPSGLLCAVPSVTSSRIPSALSQQASFLQTIDIASTQQLSMQALTRTKATDLNVGPESNSIQEPDVILMQLSHDAQWLATVDEWVPPKRDLAAHNYDDEQAVEEQDGRREIYLKFWLWDKEKKFWSLVSRVDDPHASQMDLMFGKRRVLDLIADPSSSSFATIGEDGMVKIWKASARQRHGLTVKDRQGQGLVNWECRTIIPLDLPALSPQSYMGAKIAYSPDGSCLAAALTSNSPWTIHLIDPEVGKATTGPYGPYTGSLFGLGIIDRYLIILSDQLRVWNLVTHELAFAYTLSAQQFPSRILQPQTRHLAVNSSFGTFAIALPYVNPDPQEVRTNNHSQIFVFQPTDPTPLSTMITQEPLAILTPIHGLPGYLIIDAAAEFRTLAPGRPKSSAGMALPTPPATPPRGLEGIYGDPKKPHDLVTATAQQPATSLPADVSDLGIEGVVEEDDAVVVTQEKLTEVLDCGPAYAMPPISEIFERVARLYAGSGA
ncbi:MAG: hypothetical protein Q9172_007368 [Xanthocarpia lactea]